MRHQSRVWTCGIAAIVNALECVGITKYSQGAIRRLCHSSPEDGTDEVEIQRALLACGASVDEFSTTNRVEALRWLLDTLVLRGPVVACVDNESHWITVVGYVGGSYVVFDPALGEGVKVYTSKGLLTRWRASTKPHYYGVGVCK